MNDKEILLPLKVVFPRDKIDWVRRPKKKIAKMFSVITKEVRAKFAGQANDVESHFARTFPEWGSVPAVAKVTLIPDALAKTHRPTEVFNKDTCPIIGTGAPGELFVSVCPGGVAKLVDKLTNDEAHISTIQSIEPYSAKQIEDHPPEPIKKSEKKKRTNRLRCRLFNHQGADAKTSVTAFEKFANSQGVEKIQVMEYSTGARTYCLHGVPPDSVESIRAYPVVEDLRLFPRYKLVRSAISPLSAVTATTLPVPAEGLEYPIVGQIDSGTDRDNEHLQAWVVTRDEEFVKPEMQDNSHGSFVAGLIINGKLLNHNHDLFPSVSSKIVDVVALDRDGTIDEFDLITVVDKCLVKYPNVRVWNLSLGLDTPCENKSYSMLGIALDQRMEKYDVVFVCAIGNYTIQPYRSWPKDGAVVGDEDRMCPPADAQRGIAVAGIAHLDNKMTRARKGDPSPISRRGPGPAFSIKPEVAYPAGNCDKDGRYEQTGIISIDGCGNIAESIGTSYPTPLASSLMANLIHELSVDGEVGSITTAKALMFHSAFLKKWVSDINGLHHFGIGCPADIDEILGCRQSAATVIFQVPLTSGPEFTKRLFPMPSILAPDGSGLQCEVFMTLLYDPPLDSTGDFEYTRCNIDAAFGTIRKDKDGKDSFQGELNSFPEGMLKAYPKEEEQVRLGYKWSPLKFYYREFTKGPWEYPWELRLKMSLRSEFVLPSPVNAVLIVTIKSFKPGDKVYDSLVAGMNRLGWAAMDLRTSSRARFGSR